MTEPLTETQQKILDEVRTIMHHQLVLLVRAGYPLDMVLGTMHGVAVSEIAATFGGEFAARHARGMADKVEGLPPVVDVPWATQAGGRPC